MSECRRCNGEGTIVCPRCIIRKITGLTAGGSDDDCDGCHGSGEMGCPICEGTGLRPHDL
jgi:hypothetical protein